MRIKIFTLAMVCTLLLTALGGCNPQAYDHIYDDAELLASSGNQYSATMSSSMSTGGNITYRATFNGMLTLWSYRASDGEEVEMTCSLSVSEGGDAKLILITPSGDIHILEENTNNYEQDEPSTYLFTMEEGQHYIKVVGKDSPRLEVNMSCADGVFGTD